jgi:hypothetical protein
MHFNFKNRSLLVLAITALACSRAIFAFIDDPEGPNLLVVTTMAAVIYLISSAVYLSNVFPPLTGSKEIWLRFSSRYSSLQAFTWDCADIWKAA